MIMLASQCAIIQSGCFPLLTRSSHIIQLCFCQDNVRKSHPQTSPSSLSARRIICKYSVMTDSVHKFSDVLTRFHTILNIHQKRRCLTEVGWLPTFKTPISGAGKWVGSHNNNNAFRVTELGFRPQENMICGNIDTVIQDVRQSVLTADQIKIFLRQSARVPW